MREIKFRIWHEPTKEMVYLNDIWICTEYSSLAFRATDEKYSGIDTLPGNGQEENVNKFEVMQYAVYRIKRYD